MSNSDKKLKIRSEVISSDILHGDIDDVIQKLKTISEKYNSDRYGGNTQLSIIYRDDHGDDGFDLSVIFTSPETDDEVKLRIKKEENIKMKQETKLMREKKEFERLLKKFGKEK